MKEFALAFAAALTLGTAANADPAEGTWKTQPGDTGGYLHVDVMSCGAKICGVIVQAFDKTNASVANYEHAGKKMLWDMVGDGKGYYSRGRVWAPDTDKTYKSKMTLTGNVLKVQGCVFGICRGQDWKRQ